MITQTFKLINGEYVNGIVHWLNRNDGTIESIKISHPTGHDPFYGDMSIISELESRIALGGLDGTMEFKFPDDKTLKITFYGALPLKEGCYQESEISLNNTDSFDFAIDTIADSIKAYLEENEEETTEEASDEPF